MNKLSRKPRSNPLFLKGIKIQGKLVKNKCVTGHNKKEIALSKKNEKMPLVKRSYLTNVTESWRVMDLSLCGRVQLLRDTL